MRIAVFDVETDRLLDPATRSNHADLRVTVAVAYVYIFDLDASAKTTPRSGSKRTEADATVHEWFPGGEEPDTGDFCAALDAADAVVAYNGRDFDLRVLPNHEGCDAARVRRWTKKLVDPFEAIRSSTGSWVKLDELLDANGLPRKTGDGCDAVDWWAAGERRKVADYCRKDVEALAALLLLPGGRFAFPVKRWTARRTEPDAEGRSKRLKSVAVVDHWAELDWGAYLAWRASGLKRTVEHLKN